MFKMQLSRKRKLLVFLFFISPILITFIINIGLIWEFTNQITFVSAEINYISTGIKFSGLANLLIGVTTSIAVFFGFAPIVLSLNTVPLYIIRKYLLKHNVTYRFFAFQASVGFVIAFFASFNSLARLNIYWCFILFFASFTASVLYFYWLSKALSTQEIVSMIFEKMDPRILIPKEEKYAKKRKKLEDQNNFEDLLFGFEINNPWSGLSNPNIRINEMRTGLLDHIDLNTINALLEPVNQHITTVEFSANLGDYLPKTLAFDYTQEKTPYALLTIYFVDDDSREAAENHIQEVEEKLKKAVTIKSDKDYKRIHDKLDHILDIYEYSIKSGSDDFSLILDALNDYLFERYNEPKTLNSSFNYEEEILKYTTDKLISYSKRELTDDHLDALFVFAYSLMRFAIKNKSLHLINAVYRLINTTLFKTISNSGTNQPKLLSFGLNIHELVFRCGSYSIQEEQDPDSFREDIRSFYNPLIYQGLHAAVTNYGHLIEFYTIRNEIVSEKYLVRNAQYLIDFLNPVFFWQPEELQDWKENLSNHLSKYLLYLSMLIFKKCTEGELPEKLLRKIALPFVDYSNNFFKDRIQVKDLLNAFFYDYNFCSPSNQPETDWFEFKLHQSGTYSPSYYNFDKFWMSLSVYRKTNGLSFIPTETSLPDRRLQEMNGLLENLTEEKILELVSFLDLPEDKKLDIVSDYRDHINSLIAKNGS